MTPKQMKYLALFGLIVVVLFLAAFMTMRVTEGAQNKNKHQKDNKKCKDSTKPLWDKSTKTCVSACPTGYTASGNKCVVLKPAKVTSTTPPQTKTAPSV